MAVSTKNSQAVETALEASPRLLHQVLAYLEVLLLAVWLGSMIFFSFAVAPSAFAVLPTRHLAGTMVTSTIAKVEMLGLIIGPLLILIQLITWKAKHASNAVKYLSLGLTLLMIVAAALSRFWVSSTMTAIRNSMGGIIDEVPVTDPLRVQFNSLHHYSVTLMSVALFSGLALLFFWVRSWIRR